MFVKIEIQNALVITFIFAAYDYCITNEKFLRCTASMTDTNIEFQIIVLKSIEEAHLEDIRCVMTEVIAAIPFELEHILIDENFIFVESHEEIDLYKELPIKIYHFCQRN